MPTVAPNVALVVEEFKMIEHAQFKNFKSLADVSVSFGKLTVFVGPNGSGKSNILQALHYLSELRYWEPSDLFSETRHLFHLMRKGNEKTMELTCANATINLRFSATLPMFKPEEPAPYTSKYVGSDWEMRIEGRRTSDNEPWKPIIECRAALEDLGGTKLLRLNVGDLALPSYAKETDVEVAANGEGLPSMLAAMALERPDAFEELQANLRSVIPQVRSIRFKRVPLMKTETESIVVNDERIQHRVRRQYVGDSILFDFENVGMVPAFAASDGTVLVLGLLSILTGFTGQRTILLDDIENGLHPHAQKRLVDVFRTLQENDPNLQIVATSHSPYLLDFLQPAEVRICSLGIDGSTACKPLTNHPEYERWKEEMAPGELWSVFGEDWVRSTAPISAES